MIRTLIEITGDKEWDHARDLEKTLDKLGYQPKDSAEHIRYMRDLWQEMNDRGLDPREMVKAQRMKRGTDDDGL